MIRLPEGIKKDDVDDDYPLMIYSCENEVGVEAKYKRIFQSCRKEKEDSRVKIFAFFNVGTLLKNLPEDCEQMQLQFFGFPLDRHREHHQVFSLRDSSQNVHNTRIIHA